MTKTGNPHHPKKGSTIKVEPIKKLKDIKAIQNLLASKHYEDDDYLFQSQRRDVLTVPSVHKLVKSWCSEINLKGTYRTRNPLKHQAVSERINVLSLERGKNRKILIRRKTNCNTCACILFLF